ncbi:transcriptional regulator CitB [Vibrio cholerae]|nr:transcriptional regulator CitB [Vibrio cholerae]
MMELIDVLIVEDETSIADVHSFYLKQTARFRPVGVAQSINEARNMVRILKPKLIFLDNYLPDGRGIEFLKELTHQPQAPDVIFITAAPPPLRIWRPCAKPYAAEFLITC